VRKTKKTLVTFCPARAFLGKCALPSTKREGTTGYGGCARIYGRGRRRTALDGNLTHRSYQLHAKVPFNWSVAAFSPPALEHRVLKGKTWLSISGCPAAPINDGHTGFKDAFADYAEPNEPGARRRRRHRRRRQRKRRPPVSTYTSSTEGVAAWQRAMHVVAPRPGGVYGVISRGEF